MHELMPWQVRQLREGPSLDRELDALQGRRAALEDPMDISPDKVEGFALDVLQSGQWSIAAWDVEFIEG